MAENSNSGWGTGSGSTGSTGSTGTGTTGSTGSMGSSGSGLGSGSSGGGMSSGGMSAGGGMSTGSGSGNSPFGVTSATDRGGTGSSSGTGTGSETGICPHCGQSMKSGSGLEQFLGRLGITEDMINNLKTQFQNVEIDDYLNTARDYLKDSSGKASTYAKENPGKVAAGVAALALGAGLFYAATNRDKA
jgi:hypothetical protein